MPNSPQCLVRLGEGCSYCVCHRELDVLLPDIDYVEIPVDWWNAEADKSLLIGVFKHGVYPAIWWVLVCEGMSTSGSGGDVILVQGTEPWPCSPATPRQDSSPQVLAACLGREQVPHGA